MAEGMVSCGEWQKGYQENSQDSSTQPFLEKGTSIHESKTHYTGNSIMGIAFLSILKILSGSKSPGPLAMITAPLP